MPPLSLIYHCTRIGSIKTCKRRVSRLCHLYAEATAGSILTLHNYSLDHPENSICYVENCLFYCDGEHKSGKVRYIMHVAEGEGPSIRDGTWELQSCVGKVNKFLRKLNMQINSSTISFLFKTFPLRNAFPQFPFPRIITWCRRRYEGSFTG